MDIFVGYWALPLLWSTLCSYEIHTLFFDVILEIRATAYVDLIIQTYNAAHSCTILFLIFFWFGTIVRQGVMPRSSIHKHYYFKKLIVLTLLTLATLLTPPILSSQIFLFFCTLITYELIIFFTLFYTSTYTATA